MPPGLLVQRDIAEMIGKQEIERARIRCEQVLAHLYSSTYQCGCWLGVSELTLSYA